MSHIWQVVCDARDTELSNRYLQRKQRQEAQEASLRASKSLKANKELADRDMVFGDVIQTDNNNKRKPLSPMITIPSPNPFAPTGTGAVGGGSAKRLKFTIGGKKKEVEEDGPGRADKGARLEEGGMGIRDEAMGMIIGGKGLKEVGRSLEEEE